MRRQTLSLLNLSYCVFLLPVPTLAHNLSAGNDTTAVELSLLRSSHGRSCKVIRTERILSGEDLEYISDTPIKILPITCVPETDSDSCFSEQIISLGQTESDAWKKARTECDSVYQTGGLGISRLPTSLLADGNQRPQQVLTQRPMPRLEVHPLPNLVTGPSSNRVDIVFFSDGYTVEEKSKFYDDATRLAVAITVNQTYAPVAPLLNFWGAFTPSAESGIGVGGKPKDTVYGLYRDGTELRGVYTSKPKVAEAACKSLGLRCNYPLLLGNDPLYGGLGGDFTISTASVLNGPLVLRHELGHSIIWIGDEYDGSIYFGVNADAPAYNESIKWGHWLSESASANTPPRVERNHVPLLAYPWTILNISDPWSTTFRSDGTFSYALLRFSLSAVPDAEALHIKLDGKDVAWEAKPGVGIDRWFYDVWVNERKEGLRNGTHELSFALQEGGKEGLAQLCSVEVIEYGNENEFNFTEGYVGAFPTYSPEEWDEPNPPEPDRLSHHELDSTDLHASFIQNHSAPDWQTVSYRPTNEGCLMRQVAMPDFCVVCTEHLWLRLLSRINLIDDVLVSSTCSSGVNDAHTTINISLVPLAHLRSPLGAAYIQHKGVEEAYYIRWFEHGTEIEAWRNLTDVEIECGTRATYEVEVTFKTSEIRKDEKNYTVGRRRLVVGEE